MSRHKREIMENKWLKLAATVLLALVLTAMVVFSWVINL